MSRNWTLQRRSSGNSMQSENSTFIVLLSPMEWWTIQGKSYEYEDWTSSQTQSCRSTVNASIVAICSYLRHPLFAKKKVDILCLIKIMNFGPVLAQKPQQKYYFLFHCQIGTSLFGIILLWRFARSWQGKIFIAGPGVKLPLGYIFLEIGSVEEGRHESLQNQGISNWGIA